MAVHDIQGAAQREPASLADLAPSGRSDAPGLSFASDERLMITGS